MLLHGAELAAELLDVHAMLCHFTRAKKNHRHVPPIAFPQHQIAINIYFSESCAKLAQQRHNRGFRFLAEMTTWARVKRHFTRAGGSQTRVFGMRSGFKAHGFGFEYF